MDLKNRGSRDPKPRIQLVMIPDAEAIDALVIRAQRGDRSAFDAVVEALHPEVAAFAALRVADRDLADEVVQTAFVDAYLHLADYRTEELPQPGLEPPLGIVALVPRRP